MHPWLLARDSFFKRRTKVRLSPTTRDNVTKLFGDSSLLQDTGILETTLPWVERATGTLEECVHYFGFRYKGLESKIHITFLSPFRQKKPKQHTISARHFLSFLGKRRGSCWSHHVVNPPSRAHAKQPAIYSCIHSFLTSVYNYY